MPGPLPKNPATRARGNRASSRAVLPREHTVQAPALPEGEQPWHPDVLRWWESIWRSPMAVEWLESDVRDLTVLASLHHDFLTADKVRDRVAIAAEIRLQSQRFGTSPLDRRRLQWSVEAGESAAEKTRQRRARTIEPAGGDDDPRNFLYSS